MGLYQAFTSVAVFQCLYLYWLLSCGAVKGADANKLSYDSTTCTGQLFREDSHMLTSPSDQCEIHSSGRYSEFESQNGQAFAPSWDITPHATADVYIFNTVCDPGAYFTTQKFIINTDYPQYATEVERVECDCSASTATFYTDGSVSKIFTLGECTSLGTGSTILRACGDCSVSPAGGDSDSAASFLRVETLKQALALCFFVYGVLFV